MSNSRQPSAPGEPEIYWAGKKFVLGEKKLPRFPLLLDGTGRLVEPVNDYLRERALWQNVAIGSLADEAYVLRAWWAFLEARGLGWRDASDELLREWALQQERAGVTLNRIERRLYVVFGFYYIAQTRFGIIHDLIEDPEKGKTGGHHPVSVNIVVRQRPNGTRQIIYRPRFRYTTKPKVQAGGRPTPSDEQAERVLDRLLDQPDDYTGARNWLCGGWMLNASLRREGVGDLTTVKLAEALLNEGIMEPEGRPYDLAGSANDPSTQSAILDRIYALLDQGRENFYVGVTEKRRKTRVAEVPIRFFLLNLEFIWDQRAELVRTIKARRPNYEAPDGLWLHRRTGEVVSAKAIGNIIKQAFKESGVRGSGHRLRAAYAIRAMREEYLRARAAHGRMWDPRTVLDRIAEKLGHDGIDSLRPYLNRIRREEELLDGEPVLVEDRAKAPLIRALVEAVNKGDEVLMLRLEELAKEFDLAPRPEITTLSQLRETVEKRLDQLRALRR